MKEAKTEVSVIVDRQASTSFMISARAGLVPQVSTVMSNASHRTLLSLLLDQVAHPAHAGDRLLH